MDEALSRIVRADEIVTYNGKVYDIPLLAEFANLAGPLPIRGIHFDMRTIRWSDEIWGSKLQSTYDEYFSEWPEVPDTYEGSIELDVRMTLALWRLWKAGGMMNAAIPANGGLSAEAAQRASG